MNEQLHATPYSFVTDEVLYHWFMDACQQDKARMAWSGHVQDPF